MRIDLSTALLTAATLWTCWSPTQAAATTPDGTWIVGDRVAIQVYDCSSLLCGRIVWLRNPALRTPQMCGRTIVWGLTPDGPSNWTNGSFFDPENNTTYDLSAQQQSEDTIAARIYDGMPLFGRTEILKQIQPQSLQGWC